MWFSVQIADTAGVPLRGLLSLLTPAPPARNQVIASLSSLSEAGSNQDLSVLVPEDVMTVIDRGRNPDFHTRTSLSELVTHNQHVAATTMTFDVSQEMIHAFYKHRMYRDSHYSWDDF